MVFWDTPTLPSEVGKGAGAGGGGGSWVFTVERNKTVAMLSRALKPS